MSDKESIRRFFETSGIRKLPTMVAEGQADDFRSKFGITDEDVPENFKKVVDKVRTAFIDAKENLFTQLVDVYAAAFTDEEIATMITFFDTSAGKKITELGGIMSPARDCCDTWTFEVMKSVDFTALIEEASTSLLATELKPETQPEPQPQP